MMYLVSGSIIPAVGASIVIAIVFGIFKSFSKSKDSVSENIQDVPETFRKQLHITDKSAFLERIDYWINEGNYKEAKHLCKMFENHNGPDFEINKRLKKIKLYR